MAKRALITGITGQDGSYLADLVSLIPGVSRWIPAIPDLSERGMAKFNEATPDSPGTVYLSVACWTPFSKCTPAMWVPHLILQIRNGCNDGQVPLESGKWGRVLEEMEYDHIQVLGMRYGPNAPPPGSHLDLYGRISKAIAEIE